MSDGEMKLTYFNGRGRAEMTRLLFKLAEKPFIDNRVDGETWEKFKPSTPKGQLPVLEANGKMMCESTAIARFVARETGCYGADNYEAAVCDMVADTTVVVFEALVEKRFKAKTDEEQAEAQKKIESTAEVLEKFVLSLIKGTFVLGDKASFADVMIYSVVEFMKTMDLPFSYESVPTLEAIATSFAALPSIAEWIKNRPESAF